MKKILFLFIAIGLCHLGLYAQNFQSTWKYKEKDFAPFNDRPLSSIISKNRCTWPMFHKTKVKNDTIVFAELYIPVYHLNKKDRDYNSSENLWLCLDQNLSLKFVFPLHTYEPMSGPNDDFIKYESGYRYGALDFSGKELLKAEYLDIRQIGDKIVARKEFPQHEGEIRLTQFIVKHLSREQSEDFWFFWPRPEMEPYLKDIIDDAQLKNVFDGFEAIWEYDFDTAIVMFEKALDGKYENVTKTMISNIRELNRLKEYLGKD